MAKQMMKAVRFHAHGGPEVLVQEDVPVPEIGADDVLVRVVAAGVNPPDWYMRAGFSLIPPELRPVVELPCTPGTDVSGVIEAAGANVRHFAPGDEVFGLIRFPTLGSKGYAEYNAAPASDLARKPTRIDHVHAAAVPMAALTAWQFLIDPGEDRLAPGSSAPHRPPPVGRGTRVLINGAAGGVGHFALQLAKWKGAEVIAVASGRHEAFLRDLGADEIIDYTRTNAEDVVRDVDLVLDTVGGPNGHRFLRVLKRGGMLSPVFFGDFRPAEAAQLGVSVSSTQVRSSGAQLSELGRLLDAGTLRVAIDSTFALADASRAHERAERGHLQGKIVLRVT
jgi:NADPH:quinone reductase-like Zn-dependent oxidoreductase